MSAQTSKAIQKDIVVPPMGESVTEATIARWMKKTGEAVTMDEPLVELETDKVTLEVGAPVSGVLGVTHFNEGDNVTVGAILGYVLEGATTTATTAASAPVSMPQPTSQPAAVAPQVLSPAVNRLVTEHNLNPQSVSGTGKDGRITKGDVLTLVNTPALQKAAPVVGPAREAGLREERVKMTRLRQRIAERLKEAQNTAAILTTFNEVDMTNIMQLRNSLKDNFEKKHGVKLGFMSFFVKAVLVGLKEIPAVNAEISGDSVIYKNYYDIGVAVGTEQGLVVPVLRNTDNLSFAEIEKGISDLGKKARDGKLTMEDLQGGTFTISNGGIYGSLMSTPILNTPQSGILGMHKIQERPIVVNGQIVARPMMYIALSYDHRIIDGKEAVTFLVRVKECLENPERILLEV
ncbi:Dihydrolipoyllysine-residue succinyltransferase component of 2-oxoglutarate dehydrogenase complex [Candidatus Bealeia paramacronuclearis]|uniref:Dihydrolipoyllysine-residue succinyltransferase component of 2-oxoglutarate dehydrogenase complex n=1 Tax=Candidatus Bealeia paramacronuclearis TaxID=1921001 RepID=A0ABZ2C413_9PROT|nr:Dihydrolipoyllysine-residue succinyltransferase component of 2-oxoglutarate dehydrogenase complex [Candidatus Bealeia paramacronuclearis]